MSKFGHNPCSSKRSWNNSRTDPTGIACKAIPKHDRVRKKSELVTEQQATGHKDHHTPADEKPDISRVTDYNILEVLSMVSHSDKTGKLDWCRRIVLAALLAMLALVSVANPAQAANINLDIERGAHKAHISTEGGAVDIKYDIKASGSTDLFCTKFHATRGCEEYSFNDAGSVTYAVETVWRDNEGNAVSGFVSRSAGAVNGRTSRTRNAQRNANWYWDRTVDLIDATESRPLRATMTLVETESGVANIGPNNTLKWNVNPRISLAAQSLTVTEGTDTHAEFTVRLTPAALVPVTVDYATSDGTATAGSDYTSTSGTLTFAAGESVKTIQVPITNDAINDSGETFTLTLSNPSGVTRLVLLDGAVRQFVGSLTNTITILNDEPGDNPNSDDVSLVAIAGESGYVIEGSDAVFKLTRTGDTDSALTVNLAVAETGAMLSASPPTSATFDAGKAQTELRVTTAGDNTKEKDSTLTVTLSGGEGYRLGTNNQSAAGVTVLDDDAAPVPEPTEAVAGTTVWTADMTVEDYGNGSIGAGTATLLANQRGTEDLQAKWLYYNTDERKLRMAFTTNVDSGGLTLKAQGVDLPFPNGSSGDSSFTWNDIDINWTDDQTFEAHLVRGEVKAKPAPDPNLKTLNISGATLSTAFNADTVLYKATTSASTDTVTVTAVPNDTGAAVKFDPTQDADSTQDNHQVAVPVGQSLASVIVTTSDGKPQRTYRILFTRPPTVAVSFGSVSYTATEGGDAASVTVELSADPKRDITIPLTASPGGGATAGDYTVAENVVFTTHGPLSKTLDVAAISDDDSEEGESVSLSFGTLPDGVSAQGITKTTVTLADVSSQAVNTAPTGLPTITGTPQVNETLTASVSGITDSDGTESATFTYQWVFNDGASDSDIDNATGSTYTPVPADAGSTIKVRVTFTDDKDNEETLTSEATVAVAATVPTASLSLTVALGGQDQELDVSWQAPSSNGGSNVTGYRVQWKEAVDSWDTAADVSEAAETGTTHTITSLTGGVEYAVRIIATNSAGDGPASAEAKGTPAGAASEQTIEAENSAPTGLPTISGTPQVDKTLTADTSPIDDSDGLTSVSYEYQWIAGGSDIAGATGSTYALTYSEQGKTIQVRVTFTDDADNTETLTSEATVAVAAAPNREATGLPTISGTPQVDQTLTADTSPIDDADGLTNVSYEYQWLAGGTDIAGATGSTYELTSSEQGKTIQVRVTFTDDADNEETLTSIATAAVAAAPVPLTVSVTVSAPASHDGSSEFTFEIEFSEEFGLSYRTLKFDAFNVTGGSVKRAQRTDKPSNIPWRIEIKPQGTGDVTIELPATTDCAADGAICTGDGRKLSNSLSFTVSGPGQ